MRTQNIQNAVSIEYPNQVVQINDRNMIKITSLTSDTVGGRLTFTCGTESVTIEYQSELSFLIFRINSCLKKICDGQHQTVTVTGNISNDNVDYAITSFTMYVELGRTLNSRPAGCCRTMYYQSTDDLEKVDIYVPVSGTATVGQYVYTLHPGVNSLNLTEYSGSAITPPSGDFSINIHLSYSHSDTPTFFGDLWKHTSGVLADQTDYTINMISVTAGSDCSDTNSLPYAKIQFLDVDGCYKMFLGKVMQMKYTSKSTEYVNNDLVMNNPAALVTETGQEMTIGFMDVAEKAYLYDIMYSTKIQYLNGYNQWMDAILVDTSLTQGDADSNDVEIKIKVLA